MYKEYSQYLKEKFGSRVQKIPLNAGFNCPNRDGKIGTNGCTYCNNYSFTPFYGNEPKPIEKQLSEGINFFGKKYKATKFIAFFQSYTGTYADVKTLKNICYSVLNNPQIVGLSIATRPDCLSDEVLKLLTGISENYYTEVEIGVESCYDQTLKLLNRGHNFSQAKDAITRTANCGITVCAHLIMYLPNETKEMMLNTASVINQLPIKILKLHQLQILKGTPLAKQYQEKPFELPTLEQYIEFCAKYATLIKNDIIFERFISQSPPQMIIAPNWNGAKSYQINEKIKEEYLRISKKQNTFANPTTKMRE